MFKLTKILLSASVFLIPFYFFRFSIFGLPTNIFEMAVFLAFLSMFHVLRSTKIRPLTGSVWLYLFLLIAFTAVFFAPDKIKALGIFKGWFLVPIVLYWCVINIDELCPSSNVRRLVIMPLAMSVLVVSIWAILQRFGLITALFYQGGDASFKPYLDAGRVFGPFESPNYLAMFLVPAIFLSLPITDLTKSRLAKIMIGLLFLIPVVAVILSGSRGGLAALAGGAIIYFIIGAMPASRQACRELLNASRFLRKIRARRIIVASVIFIALLIANLVYFSYMNGKLNQPATPDYWRAKIYHYSVEMIWQHPVKGIGLGNFKSAIAETSRTDQPFSVFGLPFALHPHNLYLAFWLNLGILGLVIFLIIIIQFYNQILSHPKQSAGSGDSLQAALLAAMSAILVHGLFDTTYFKNDLAVIFWLVIGLSIITERKARERGQQIS